VIAKNIALHGICGAICQVRGYLSSETNTENEQRFFFQSSDHFDPTNDSIKESDYQHEDVCYIFQLLKSRLVNMITSIKPYTAPDDMVVMKSSKKAFYKGLKTQSVIWTFFSTATYLIASIN
jgi:hypothetical protein